MQTNKTILITGAAGFIGSHLTDVLLAQGFNVIGVDNLIRGNLNNIKQALTNPCFTFIEQDVAEDNVFQQKIQLAAKNQKIDAVWHMAANSDIPAGVSDAKVDLTHTFMTTFNTLELMKHLQIPVLLFASSSAIYGQHDIELAEDTGPIFPISNYGAMKLASEAAISAAAESFLEKAYIFRFPNVIGNRATHGIIYDFIHKLKKNPMELHVLGDGTQQKPYLHVSELVDAMLFIAKSASEKINFYNIGVPDEGVTVKSIAEGVVNVVSPSATIHYQQGNKGWVGDVPRFQYSVAKLEKLGWKANLNSQQAMEKAIKEIVEELM